MSRAKTEQEGTPPEAVNVAALSGAERRHQLAKMRHDPQAIRELFVSGDYP
jgi:hypothetical protein